MDTSKEVMMRIVKIVVSITVVILGGVLLYTISAVDLLPSNLLYVVDGISFLVIVFFLIFLWMKKPVKWQNIICTILAIALIAVEVVGTVYLNKASDVIGAISVKPQGELVNTMEIVVLDSSDYENLKDLEGKKVGFLKNLDTQGTNAVVSEFESKNIEIEQVDLDGLTNLVDALYNKDVDAIALNENFRETVKDSDDYSDFDTKTKSIKEIYFYTQQTNSASSVDDVTTTPFTVLISGSDSRNGLDATARTDVNMVVTVDPNTNTVLLVGIPRDYYVQTVCSAVEDCPNGQLDKLTHTGLYGVETTKQTIEKLLGITINYTVRVNFDAVVNLVDALGGIDVYVDEGLAVDEFWTYEGHGVEEGWNSLDGEEALAFARERYAYLEGDRQRVKNQQQVFKRIAEKATSPSMIVQYNKFMDALSGAMETNMSAEEIQELIKFQLNGNPEWNIYSYSLNGEGTTDYVASAGSYASVMYPDYRTVTAARMFIQMVLDGDSSELAEYAEEGALLDEKLEITELYNPYGTETVPETAEDIAEEAEYFQEVQNEANTSNASNGQTYTDQTYTDQTFTDQTYTNPGAGNDVNTQYDPSQSDPGAVQ